MNRVLATRAAAVMAAMLTAGCTRSAPASARPVDIVASDGVTLKGTLFPAISTASSGPAVLLLHQCDDRRTVWDPLGPRLAAAGITALSVDYRGYGESGGTPHDRLSNEQQAAVTATSGRGTSTPRSRSSRASQGST